jgi:hypothetical protein
MERNGMPGDGIGLLKGATTMPIKKHGLIIESPTEARQAEPGPSILLLLTVSTISAVVLLAAVWFVFFRT